MPNLGEVSLKIKIDSEDLAKQIVSSVANAQREADGHTITYRIAGDKSDLEKSLQQLQNMSPDILTHIKL